jgi:hypothetical protein
LTSAVHLRTIPLDLVAENPAAAVGVAYQDKKSSLLVMPVTSATALLATAADANRR